VLYVTPSESLYGALRQDGNDSKNGSLILICFFYIKYVLMRCVSLTLAKVLSVGVIDFYKFEGTEGEELVRELE